MSAKEFAATPKVATSKYPQVKLELPNGFEWFAMNKSYIDENGSTIKEEFEEDVELEGLKDKVMKTVSDESTFELLESKDLEINHTKAFSIKALLIPNNVTMLFVGIRTQGGSYLVRGSCRGPSDSKRFLALEDAILNVRVIE